MFLYRLAVAKAVKDTMHVRNAEHIKLFRRPYHWEIVYGQHISSPDHYFSWFTTPDYSFGPDTWQFATELEINALALLTGFKIEAYVAPSLQGVI